MKTCVNETAEEVIGKTRRTRKEQWITQDSWKLIDERKEAKCKCDQSVQANEEELNPFASLDKKVKKRCKKDKKAFIEKKETKAKEAAKRNDSKTQFKIVKKLTGVNSNNTVPIKDKQGKVVSSSVEQIQRWVEHFREVLNQPAPPSFLNFDNYEVMHPLEVNTDKIRITETSKAIKILKNIKAPGIDNITPELLKHGGPDIAQELLLSIQLWNSVNIPNEWRKGKIVRLPKKGI